MKVLINLQSVKKFHFNSKILSNKSKLVLQILDIGYKIYIYD